jgi:hypothetical protein
LPWKAARCTSRKQEPSFSEEKEAKRLHSLARVLGVLACMQVNKSFLVLFFKKERASLPPPPLPSIVCG